MMGSPGASVNINSLKSNSMIQQQTPTQTNQGKTVKPIVDSSLVSSNVYKISTMPGTMGYTKSLNGTSIPYPGPFDETSGCAINFSNNASISCPPFQMLAPEVDNLEDVHFCMVACYQRQKAIISNKMQERKSKKYKKGKRDENGVFLPKEKGSNLYMYAEEIDMISK